MPSGAHMSPSASTQSEWCLDTVTEHSGSVAEQQQHQQQNEWVCVCFLQILISNALFSSKWKWRCVTLFQVLTDVCTYFFFVFKCINSKIILVNRRYNHRIMLQMQLCNIIMIFIVDMRTWYKYIRCVCCINKCAVRLLENWNCTVRSVVFTHEFDLIICVFKINNYSLNRKFN